MLINGQNAAENLQDLLTQLSSLDSSFPEYISGKPPYIPTKEIDDVAKESYQSLTQGRNKKALQQFQEVEKLIPKDQPNNPFLAYIYSSIAFAQKALGNNKEAALNVEKQISEYLKVKDYYQTENVYKDLVNIWKKNGTLEKEKIRIQANLDKILEYKSNLNKALDGQDYDEQTKEILHNKLNDRLSDDQSEELKARFALGAIHRVQNNHKEALEHYAVAYELQQGKVDYDAVRVEQHEFGVSNGKIGTDNIQ